MNIIIAGGGKVGLIGGNQVSFDFIQEQELALTQRAMEGLAKVPHVHVMGSEDPANHTGIISFTVEGVHPHDVSEILASDGIDVRAGHHCAQPLLQVLCFTIHWMKWMLL